MKSQTEIELKFMVPLRARAELAAEVARGLATQRISLAAMYLDTDDRRLARAGMAWRLRREGRRWIQTLKGGGSNALERFEHEVPRPGASHDSSEHAGTPLGDKLIAVLRRAHRDGIELGVRFQTEVRRTTRRIRTRGAVVQIAFDEGRLVSDKLNQRIREVEFELTSGSTAAMLALAQQWRKRFGLFYDPRSNAERGDRLAEGSPFPPLRKANPLSYSRNATATEAFCAVLDECLAQITRNAVGLIEGDSTQRVEHVHQMRVGIRRLRSALRSFRGWVPESPAHLVEGLRSLFATLGMSRDNDVLDSGVAAELAKVGAPPLRLPGAAAGTDPAQTVKAADTQGSFLAWIAWRAALAEPPAVSEGTLATDAPTFHRHVERRLRRWHARLVAAWERFDALDEASLHVLRKRIKLQRYAVEFFAPVLRRRKVERYVTALAVIQDRMGELNDLFVARARYEALVASDPAAWFALGWLTARIAELRAVAKPELGGLVALNSPAR